MSRKLYNFTVRHEKKSMFLVKHTVILKFILKRKCREVVNFLKRLMNGKIIRYQNQLEGISNN